MWLDGKWLHEFLYVLCLVTGVRPCHLRSLWDFPHLKPYHGLRLGLLMKQSCEAQGSRWASAVNSWPLLLCIHILTWGGGQSHVPLPMTVQPACFSPWTGPQRSGVNAPVHGFVSGLMKCFLWVPDNAAHHSLTASESLLPMCQNLWGNYSVYPGLAKWMWREMRDENVTDN